MKNLFSTIAIFITIGIVNDMIAQRIDGRVNKITNSSGIQKEHKITMSSGTLNIVDINEVKVVGYDGTNIIISSEVEPSEVNERAAGLKLVNALGLDDNTGFGISAIKEGNVATIRQLSDNCSCNEVIIQVPKSINISISHRTYEAENIIVENVSSELEISSNHHNVHLKDVTGPMAVKTVHGSIDAKFSSVNQLGSISLYAAHDFVDVTFPKNAKMNLQVDAPYGDVYTNADIEITTNDVSGNSSCGHGSHIVGKLNGGGVQMSIKSAHDDIYIRQL